MVSLCKLLFFSTNISVKIVSHALILTYVWNATCFVTEFFCSGVERDNVSRLTLLTRKITAKL